MLRSPNPLPRPETSTLLVIDVQQRLLAAMEPELAPSLVRNIRILLELYETFAGAVTVTEQYPKGLGPTVEAIAERVPGQAVRFEKTAFSAFREPGAPSPSGRADIVVTGMETHVCVLQTCFDALNHGHRVFVVADAVLSRTRAHRDQGLALLEKAGAFVATTETLVFAALERAGTDVFKRFSALIR
jgi:nicotinamidase-related amidase